jgi:hypothetical protein
VLGIVLAILVMLLAALIAAAIKTNLASKQGHAGWALPAAHLVTPGSSAPLPGATGGGPAAMVERGLA